MTEFVTTHVDVASISGSNAGGDDEWMTVVYTLSLGATWLIFVPAGNENQPYDDHWWPDYVGKCQE